MLASKKRMWAAILALFSWASVQAQEAEVVKVNVAVVTVNVNVSDGKGHPLASLRAEDFQVSDEGQTVPLGYYPPDKTPGWRRIQVNLARATRRLKLRYQQRYLIR